MWEGGSGRTPQALPAQADGSSWALWLWSPHPLLPLFWDGERGGAAGRGHRPWVSGVALGELQQPSEPLPAGNPCIVQGVDFVCSLRMRAGPEAPSC